MTTLTHTRIFILAIFLVMAVSAKAQSSTIVLTNPLSTERKDELIVLSKQILEKKLGKIGNDKFIIIKNNAGRPLVVQYDDRNGDGNWDEAVFLYSFRPKEKMVCTIAVSERPATIKALVRAHVRLRRKNPDDTFGPAIDSETMPLKNPATDFSKQPLPLYLTEGPAWENDKVAFRQYMDMRNGRDIFGKRVSHMVMDSVGVTALPSYHDLNDWGMDVLHVGKSLGAGAIALQVKIRGRDTLIRLGGADITKTVYRQVSNGPVRAIFSMKYTWTINGKPVQITDETSIWGGQYFYETKITLRGLPTGAKLVEGIANFNENKSKHFEVNNAAVLYSHGKQGENKDELGMGILVRKLGFAGFGATPDAGSDILNTYTVAQNIQYQPLIYRFYAGWVKTDSRFADAGYFENFLRSETKKIDMPVSIF
ncbi:MAG: DUF4861 domain-containing protein [Ferruginibacter sp.]|nr:DUF4861 domain-containing protein [Ferruginibacter sp.]